jgi:hypothetical protein
MSSTWVAWQVHPEDHSTLLGGGAYGAVFTATLHGLPVAAKTLHCLRDPVMYGLVGPDAGPAAGASPLRPASVVPP